MQQISISANSFGELERLIESYKASGWRLRGKMKSLHPEMHQYSATLENDTAEYFKQPNYRTNKSVGDFKC